MSKILIRTPKQGLEEWLECDVHSCNSTHIHNKCTIRVKGIHPKNNVVTPIEIDNIASLLSGEVVTSLHGYFKIKLMPFEDGLQELLESLKWG